MLIDFTQFRTFQECPLKWYERYVRQVGREWEGERSDPIAIGVLFHAGVENLYKTGIPTIPDDAVTEVNPDSRTLLFCRELLAGYVHAFPAEQWKLQMTEEVVVRPDSPLDIAAKIDAWFEVDEMTTLADGVVLEPGIWIQEYKTTTSQNQAKFRARWFSDKQADFQMLALEHKLGKLPQGVVVAVCEYSQPKPPMRKCRGCGEMYPLEAWLPSADKWACPVCGHIQKLLPASNPPAPTYYKIVVRRSPEQLAESLRIIRRVAEQMVSGDYIPNFSQCVTYAQCEYYNLHTFGGDSKLVPLDTTKYLRKP